MENNKSSVVKKFFIFHISIKTSKVFYLKKIIYMCMITNFNDFNLITENPDNIIFNNKKLIYTDLDAVPFAWTFINNNIAVYTGYNGARHDDSLSGFQYSGRLWLNNKIITFWSYPDEKTFIELIKKLEKILNIKIFFNNWYIEIFVNNDIIQKTNKPDTDYLKHKGIKKIIPIEQYISSDDLPEEEKAMHLMSWQEKEKLKRKHTGFGSDKTAWDSESNIQKRQLRYTSENFNNFNKTYVARKSDHIYDDIKRNWSSWNFGQDGFTGTYQKLQNYLKSSTDEKPIHISGFDIYPDDIKEYKFGELYTNYWVAIDDINAKDGLSGISLNATNLKDAIKEATIRTDYFGDGIVFDASRSKLVYSKNDIHIFEL